MVFSFLLLHTVSLQKTSSYCFEIEKWYGNEACYLFCFKTLVELRRLPTLLQMPKSNIKFCSIPLNPGQYVSDFETEVYHSAES